MNNSDAVLPSILAVVTAAVMLSVGSVAAQENPLAKYLAVPGATTSALWKHGNVGQGIYIDPERDFVGVYFSTNGYIPPYGEDKMPGYLRRAAKYLAGK